MITVHFTEGEVQQLLQVLTQTPLPYAVAHPLVQKVGSALNLVQQQQREREQNEAMRQMSMPQDIERGFGDVRGSTREHVNAVGGLFDDEEAVPH